MIKNHLVLAATLAASLSFGSREVLATSIGVNFVETDNAGLQNALPDSLGAGESAGVSGYSQTNWNNYGRWSDPITANDNFGAATTVSLAWDSVNTWHNHTNPLVTGDDKLMRGYLDATGQVNEPTFTSVFASNANKPAVYLTGVSAWLSSQSATSFDFIIYLDGDTTGRIGEYWLQSVTGAHNGFTLGVDITPHIFGTDLGDFAGTYDAVDPSATSLGAAENGNYILFAGVPAADTFLLRTEEQAARAPLNGFQIIAVPEPSTFGLLSLSTLGVMLIRRKRRA